MKIRSWSSLPKIPAILLIRMYQSVHGAFYMGCCRFEPSCSHYAVEAIETRGLGVGIALSAWRILRCNPLCKGGWDPVPAGPIRNFAVRVSPAGSRAAANGPLSPLGESLE
jgi:uncharacterized protein